jgi:hypothetical protein
MKTHVFSNGGGSVETQQQTGLQLRLGSLDLDGSRRQGHSGPLSESEVGKIVNNGEAMQKRLAPQSGNDVLNLFRHSLLGGQVDSPKTSVRV